MLKELDSRENNGITVTLFYDSDSKEYAGISPLRVLVSDVKTGDRLSIGCDTVKEAREAFAHPYGVANSVLKSGRIAA